jgi:hypothetical protein
MQHIYINNKKNYLRISRSNNLHNMLVSGGGKRAMHSLEYEEDIVLPNPVKTVQKLGSFEVKTNLVIGDTDYSKIKQLKPGKYNAYKIDDNLVIMHSDVKNTRRRDQKRYS